MCLFQDLGISHLYYLGALHVQARPWVTKITSLKLPCNPILMFSNCLFDICGYLFCHHSKPDMFFLTRILFSSKLSLVHFATRLSILASHLSFYSVYCSLGRRVVPCVCLLFICLKYLFPLTPTASRNFWLSLIPHMEYWDTLYFYSPNQGCCILTCRR